MDNDITSLVCFVLFVFSSLIFFFFKYLFRTLYNTQRPLQAIREYCTTTIKKMKRLRIHRCLYQLSGRVEQRLGPILPQLWPPLSPCCKRSYKASSSPPLLSSTSSSSSLSFQKHTGRVLEVRDSTFGSRAPPSVFSSKPSPFQCQQLSTRCISDMYWTHYFCVVLFDKKK